MERLGCQPDKGKDIQSRGRRRTGSFEAPGSGLPELLKIFLQWKKVRPGRSAGRVEHETLNTRLGLWKPALRQ